MNPVFRTLHHNYPHQSEIIELVTQATATYPRTASRVAALNNNFLTGSALVR